MNMNIADNDLEQQEFLFQTETEERAKIIKLAKLEEEMLFVREGYLLLIKVIKRLKEEYPEIDPRLNEFYEDLVERIRIATQKIDESAVSLVKRELVDLDHPFQVFGDVLNFPFSDLYEVHEETYGKHGDIDWNSIIGGMYRCLRRIEWVYRSCQGKLVLNSKNKQFVDDIKAYLNIDSDQGRDSSGGNANLKATFDKKNCLIFFKGKTIKVPYATNQFCFCETIFSSPHKRWENEDLVKAMLGEGAEAKRQAYDTMRSINKKVGAELFLRDRKTIKLNPEYT